MHFYPHNKDDFKKDIKISELPMVYALSSDDFKYIKVGITISPKQRFLNIQSGCPFVLSLWLAIRTPNAKQIEQFLHNKLTPFNLRGEWFSLDDQNLDELMSFFMLTNENVRAAFNG